MMDDVLNWLTLLLFVGCLAEAIWYGRRTQAWPVMLLIASYVWTVFTRISFLGHVPFMTEHAVPMVFVTALLTYLGLRGLNLAWRHFVKRTDGDRAKRDRDATVRSKAASVRDKQADVRDQHADERDQHADEREQNGNEGDHA
jgi:hypothetical protein